MSRWDSKSIPGTTGAGRGSLKITGRPSTANERANRAAHRAMTVSERETGMTPDELTEHQRQLRATSRLAREAGL